MSEALSAAISSLSLLLVQTQAARGKADTPEQLTGAHLYLQLGMLCMLGLKLNHVSKRGPWISQWIYSHLTF